MVEDIKTEDLERTLSEKNETPEATENKEPEPMEVATENPVVNSEIKSESPKKRKRKKKLPKDALAPKVPWSAYNYFMKERREVIKERCPNDGIQDLIRKVGKEWRDLSEEDRQPYIQLATKDKTRYTEEMAVYKQNKKEEEENNPKIISPVNSNTIQDVPMNEKPIPKVVAKNDTKHMNGIANPEPKIGDFDIPIFTDEFLDHNKTLDSELRTLRKSHTDYEQQNSILEKHVENMKNGVEKLNSETSELTENNRLLEAYLAKLRAKLVECFSDLPIPSEQNGATASTIDKYMTDLNDMATKNSHGPACLNKAKDIIRKTDLQIQI